MQNDILQDTMGKGSVELLAKLPVFYGTRVSWDGLAYYISAKTPGFKGFKFRDQ